MHHDPGYVRPIRSRYVDPIELVWLATAKRLGLHVRRDPDIFSMTDGSGLLALGPRSELDPDDTMAQMIFHEICHWIVNGEASFRERDWGFPMDLDLDPREHACQRLQAHLADPYGLRSVLAPTSDYRQYYDRLAVDPLEPFDDSEWERTVRTHATEAVARSLLPPWRTPLAEALRATAAVRATLIAFLPDYASESPDDALPSIWS